MNGVIIVPKNSASNLTDISSQVSNECHREIRHRLVGDDWPPIRKMSVNCRWQDWPGIAGQSWLESGRKLAPLFFAKR